MITLEKVAKIYNTDEVITYAIKDVSLEIELGEYVIILGESGSGKSTLLSILGTLEQPTEGKYIVNDVNVATLNRKELSLFRSTQLGFIFQTFNLVEKMTILQNVMLPLLCRKGLDFSEIKARANEALEKVGLDSRKNHMPFQLSGGQQQRVAIARALVGKPKLLLADEPTGNLDSKNSDLVMQLIGELHQLGVTVCLVTHNESYKKWATKLVKLSDGLLVN